MSIEVTRNNNARKFEQSCRLHRNCIRLKRKQSKEHAREIFELAWAAYSNGMEFITEATLEDYSARADIAILDNSLVIEVIKSEKQDSLDKKKVIWKNHGFSMEVIK